MKRLKIDWRIVAYTITLIASSIAFFTLPVGITYVPGVGDVATLYIYHMIAMTLAIISTYQIVTKWSKVSNQMKSRERKNRATARFESIAHEVRNVS